jgi:hypothetical protein
MASSTTPRRRATSPHAPAPPTPQELVAAPELAVLDALQHVIDLAGRMLLAAHPELVGERSHLHPLDLQATLAERAIRLAALLANATTRYQTAVLTALHEPDTDEDDDIPF